MIDLLNLMPDNQISQIVRNIATAEADYKRHFSEAVISHYQAIRHDLSWNFMHRNNAGQDCFYKINHYTTHQMPIDILSELEDTGKIPQEFIYTNNYQVIQLITHFNECPNRNAYFLSSRHHLWERRQEHFQGYNQTQGTRSFQKSVRLENEVEVILSAFSRL